MRAHDPRRRALMLLLAAGLANACSPRSDAGGAGGFEALDISGADWGRDFALRDARAARARWPTTAARRC